MRTSEGVPGSLRPIHGAGLPLLWRAFLASALIMVLAAALLVLTPVTIHAPVTTGQLAIILAGLALMLGANLLGLRTVLAPLRKLTALMSRIDPDRPGERISRRGATAREPADARLTAAPASR